MVIVYSLSRLGRKLTDVIGWIELLSKKNIDFISMVVNWALMVNSVSIGKI